MIRDIYTICHLSASTHQGRVMHIFVSKIVIVGSDNGLSPCRRQAIIWTKAWILWIWPSGTNLSDILIENITFSFTKVYLTMSSAKWLPLCFGLNVLNGTGNREKKHVYHAEFVIWLVKVCRHKELFWWTSKSAGIIMFMYVSYVCIKGSGIWGIKACDDVLYFWTTVVFTNPLSAVYTEPHSDDNGWACLL